MYVSFVFAHFLHCVFACVLCVLWFDVAGNIQQVVAS